MKVGIVGLGLIGGSLGIDLRQQGYEIYGVSRQQTTCDVAIERGICDRASTELSSLASAEIVILCTPIAYIALTLEQLVPYLRPETIVTDVGSVKQSIVTECSQLWHNFIGGHPMAGTSEQGINAAIPNLFQGAAYVFTPSSELTNSESTNSESNNLESNLELLQKLARDLGAIPYICQPEVHDRAVAWISHLPVMVSGSLVAACLGEAEPGVLDLAQHLASSGFRDTSRVGAGNPELGKMMAQYNQQALLQSLYAYRTSLDGMIEHIEQADWDSLGQILQTNQQARPKFLN